MQLPGTNSSFFASALARGTYRSASNIVCFGGGRKPEHPEQTHVNAKHANSTQNCPAQTRVWTQYLAVPFCCEVTVARTEAKIDQTYVHRHKKLSIEQVQKQGFIRPHEIPLNNNHDIKLTLTLTELIIPKFNQNNSA